jgi:uncharacterized protein (DUF2147 family)
MRSLRRAAAVAGMIWGLAVLDASAGPADDVLGLWLTQSGNGVVEISRCGGSICGRIVGGRGERLDVNNRDRALRTRELMGVVILSGYRESAAGWVGGRIYNPEDGASYRSELAPGPQGTLRVIGCLGPFCRTQVWTRTERRGAL